MDLRRGREVDSLLGLGVHKCPAGSFIDQVGDKVIILDSCSEITLFADDAAGVHSWLRGSDGTNVSSDIESHIREKGS